MATWCTPDDVRARLSAGSVTPLGLLQEYCEQATSTLYALSGRRFPGEGRVTEIVRADAGGVIKLGLWSPVRAIVSLKSNGEDVSYRKSRAGTRVYVTQGFSGRDLEIVMDIGQNPPAAGQRAAAALAAELLREDPRYAAIDDGGSPPKDVRTSSRVSSISRQGKTITFLSPQDLAKANLTGIFETDMFLRAVNPKGAQYQPKVVNNYG